MTTAEFGFDVSRLAIREINLLAKEESARIGAMGTFRSAVSYFRGRLASRLSETVANHLLGRIERQAERLADHAVWLAGAKDVLIYQMACFGHVPSEKLVFHLEKLLGTNASFQESCERSMRTFTNVNADSRIAAMLARIHAITVHLDSSIKSLHAVAKDGLEHKDVLLALAGHQKAMDEQLMQYGEDQDFDPELVALADAAIQRINVKARLQIAN